MQRYLNQPCAYCEKKFKENDDVVVCPDCGTPHHRECYFENNACVNKELHNNGFEWKSNTEKEFTDINTEKEANDGRTPLPLPGLSLLLNDDEKKDSRLMNEKTFDGVSELELTAFLGQNNRFYIKLFRFMLDRKRRVTMNILAGFFSPFYQFYRRMTGFGFVLAAVTLLTQFYNLLPFLIVLFPNDPKLTQLMQTLSSSNVDIGFLNGLYYLNLTVMILTCLFNDYFYLKWTLRKIKSIRSRFEDTDSKEYYRELARCGNPKFSKMLLFSLVSAVAISFILMLIIYFV